MCFTANALRGIYTEQITAIASPGRPDVSCAHSAKFRLKQERDATMHKRTVILSHRCVRMEMTYEVMIICPDEFSNTEINDCASELSMRWLV